MSQLTQNFTHAINHASNPLEEYMTNKKPWTAWREKGTWIEQLKAFKFVNLWKKIGKPNIFQTLLHTYTKERKQKVWTF